MESKRIELCVPAERNMFLVMRMTTAGVMARVGLTLDETDDMKMAVDEVCNMMMLQKTGCGKLSIVYEYNEQTVTVWVEGQDTYEAADDKKNDANMQEVIRCILESMVDEVEMTEREDGSTKAVRLMKKVPDRRRVIA